MVIEGEQKVGACWECGYSLRGLTTPRCPECGRPFDPNDATTMNMGISVGPVKRFLMRPPGWPLYLLAAFAALWSLWAAATPTPPGTFVDTLGNPEEWRSYTAHLDLAEGRFLWGALLWAIALSIWTFRRVARGVTVLRLSKQRAATFAYWRRWLWPLVLFAATIVCCLTRLPVMGGCWLSSGSSEEVMDGARAKVTRPGMVGYRVQKWIGIYPPPLRGRSWFVHEVWERGGETWIFLHRRGALVNQAGGLPPEIKGTIAGRRLGMATVHHLYGPWYSVSWEME